MEAPAPTVIHTARFNPLYRPYLVITIGLTMIVSIIGIPLAPFWFCGVGQWWARHYYNLLQCQLSDRALRFRKGILVQVEKTIPLENIQDVTFVEGPVLRRFNLSTIKFETAGHSGGQAHDMQLTGIIDAQDFRNRILAARDALRAQRAGDASVAAHRDAGEAGLQSQEQLRILRAMSERLDEIAAVLKERR
jgi:putative membrane protein